MDTQRTTDDEPTLAQIRKWVRALRSDKFKQTLGALQNSRGHCCLGVACEIFISPKDQKRERLDIYSACPQSSKYLFGELPSDQDAAPLWLKNLADDFQAITGIDIAELNDSRRIVYYDGPNKRKLTGRLNFNEIADVLELIYVHKALG